MTGWEVIPKSPNAHRLMGCVSVTKSKGTQAGLNIGADVFETLGYPAAVLLLSNGSRFALAPTTEDDPNGRKLQAKSASRIWIPAGVIPPGRYPVTFDDEGRAVFEVGK